MQTRYQVFLSSTYEDLKEERLEVMKALIELDCFPSGMEYFPASNNDQWSYIQALIDECDYYIVILGGRYGSVDENGMGFTEKEYRYAIEKGIPVLGFVHANPNSLSLSRSQTDEESQRRLAEFRALVKSRLCKEWATAAELGAVVSRSLTRLIKSTKRPGWVRATEIASAEASKEIIRLRHTIDELQDRIQHLTVASPSGAESLAQGDDVFSLEFHESITGRDEEGYAQRSRVLIAREFTWDRLFQSFAPYLLSRTKLSAIKSGLGTLVREHVIRELQQQDDNQLDTDRTSTTVSITILESSLQRVIIQFTALGYLETMTEIDSEGKEVRLAELTPLGRRYLTQTMAIHRVPSPGDTPRPISSATRSVKDAATL
ncbi:MAG: DUF4062 domain-containing protein [Burkholderiaceae bacterium]|nr:DUF4062 domain-containing protein [Burkholderiaceae bacterium]